MLSSAGGGTLAYKSAGGGALEYDIRRSSNAGGALEYDVRGSSKSGNGARDCSTYDKLVGAPGLE